jgi:hypothetical protein
MIGESARILDLESYRRAGVAAQADVDGPEPSAPVTNYGAISTAPFALPMAFLMAWPTFVFSPWAGQIQGQPGEARHGVEPTG